MEDEIHSSRKSSLVCGICTKSTANYVCPRCSINYCSLGCYRDRRHGTCSENFYRECCERAASDLSDNTSYREQINLLSEQDGNSFSKELLSDDENSEDSDDDDNPADLATRLRDIDLTAENIDVDRVWSLLSVEERREFHRQLATGNIYSVVPVWTPWWQSASRKLVTSFPDDFLDSREASIIPPAKPLSNLISTRPHMSVMYSLAEVLLGFCFTARYFNGTYLNEMCVDASDVLLKLVDCLRGPQCSTADIPKHFNNKTTILSNVAPIFTNFEEVLANIQKNLAQNLFSCSQQVLLIVVDDLNSLLNSLDHLKRALFHLETTFGHVLKQKVNSKQLLFAIRKTAFLRSCVAQSDDASKQWVETYLPALQKAVAASICSQTMRIEQERLSEQPVQPKVRVAGPSWRNIIRKTAPNKAETEMFQKISEIYNAP